jgi:putative transposase
MPRQSRLLLPNVPVHLIQRGNSRQTCFFADADRVAYLAWLEQFALAGGCRIHAYVLMTNHLHLLISASEVAAISGLMKALGQRYTHYFNRRYHRTGTLWDGRYKSCLVQEERYFLVCQRYIELNPVRAGVVAAPVQYAWSSYRGNAEGRSNTILQPHSVYLRLGATAVERQRAYRGLFDQQLPAKVLEQLRIATNNDFAFGDQAFMRRAAASRGAASGSDPGV